MKKIYNLFLKRNIMKAKITHHDINDDLTHQKCKDFQEKFYQTCLMEIITSVSNTCDNISIFLKDNHMFDIIDDHVQKSMAEYTQEFLDNKYSFLNPKVQNYTTQEDIAAGSIILNVTFLNETITMVIR